MAALLKMTPRTTTNALPGTGGATLPRRYPAPAGAERRMFPRREQSGRVTGKRLDHALPALRNPSLTLELRDVSVGGLSALSPSPLERGERLTVTFPALGVFAAGAAKRAGWDAVGRVVRCEQSGLGYRVAVEFDAVPTAA
jgi:hypothetical protein